MILTNKVLSEFISQITNLVMQLANLQLVSAGFWLVLA